MTDWIRYKDQFIEVQEIGGGRYLAEVTSIMPDVPVRDMLVAATFEGTYIQQAPATIKQEVPMQLFKPQSQAEKDAKSAEARRVRASYPLPIRIILTIIEAALYIILGGFVIIIFLAIPALIVFGLGKLFGAW